MPAVERISPAASVLFVNVSWT